MWVWLFSVGLGYAGVVATIETTDAVGAVTRFERVQANETHLAIWTNPVMEETAF